MSEHKPTFNKACAELSEGWQRLLARTVIPALTWATSLLLKAVEAASRAQRGRRNR